MQSVVQDVEHQGWRKVLDSWSPADEPCNIAPFSLSGVSPVLLWIAGRGSTSMAWQHTQKTKLYPQVDLHLHSLCWHLLTFLWPIMESGFMSWALHLKDRAFRGIQPNHSSVLQPHLQKPKCQLHSSYTWYCKFIRGNFLSYLRVKPAFYNKMKLQFSSNPSSSTIFYQIIQ